MKFEHDPLLPGSRPGVNANLFADSLKTINVNTRLNGVSLVHIVVRSPEPLHVQALLDAGIDVNIECLNRATALQWMFGLLRPQGFLFARPGNYDAQSGQSISFSAQGQRVSDNYIGQAHEIMNQIAHSATES